MTDDEALIKQEIARTREDLGEKVEAIRDRAEEIRGRADVRRRGEEKVRQWQAGLMAHASRFRQDFAEPRRAGEGRIAVRIAPGNGAVPAAGPPAHPAAPAAGDAVRESSVPPPPSADVRRDRLQAPAGARLRELGEAGVAAGWRRKVAETVAPRVAGSAPMSSGEVKAVLGLVFLAMSGSYVVKSVTTALRRRKPSERHSASAAEWPGWAGRRRMRSAPPNDGHSRAPRRPRSQGGERR